MSPFLVKNGHIFVLSLSSYKKVDNLHSLGLHGAHRWKKQNRRSRHSLPVSSSELSFEIVLELSKRVAVKGNELSPVRLLIC